MRRLPNKYERCILYQGAKDEAFASPGEHCLFALQPDNIQ